MEKKTRMIKNILMYILLFLGVVLLFLVLTFLVLNSNYKNWERDIQLLDMTILDLESDISAVEFSLGEKIEKYNQDEGSSSFVEFDKQESLLLFSKSLNESVPNGVEIQKMGLIAYHGSWFVYFSGDIFSFSLPWIGFNLQKDDVQSIDIYVEDMYLGNMSFRRLFLNSLVDDVNVGIQNSLDLVDDGNFAGRVFENIELTEDSLIIRSRKAVF